MNLRYGSMSMKEYCLKFTQLSKYSLEVLPDSMACMSGFVTNVSDFVVKECMTTILFGYLDISLLMTHAPQNEARKLNERGKENKKVRTKQFEYDQHSLRGEIVPNFKVFHQISHRIQTSASY